MKITIQDARTSVTLQQRDFRVTISGARGPAGPQGDPGEGGEWGTIVGDITEQTDLYNALQAKVPYTGATQDVNLGEYGAQLGNLEFDNTPTNVPTTAGSVYWNDTDGTLNLVLKGGQTISRIGETQHIRALNNTGAQIARGKVVYVVGAQGQRLTIALADADTEILSKDTIGFTAEAIADGAEGFVIVQGVINNVSTTGMTDGATVYLSQTAGGYTTTAPTDPAHMVVLGFIVNGGSGGAGSIYVKVDNGYELEELHGVADAAKVTPVGADALLLRDSADNNLWKRLTWTNALAGVKSHMDTFKSVAGGYASLDGSGKVPASELPSYVDDVVEVANYAALPGTGETGKIYVTLDTNKCYRWSGSVYVEVSAGGGIDTLTTTGTSGAATLVGSTLNIPQYQGVLTNPVTGTGTAGQVAYFSGTSAVTGSSNLTWNGSQLNILTPSVLNTREIILKAQISDAGNDAFFIGNGTSVNGIFYPLFAGFGSNSSPGRAGLSFAGIVNPTSDVLGDAATSVIEYRAYKVPIGTDPLNETRNDVSNRILFSFFNNNTAILSMFPNGNISIGVPSSTTPSARLHVRGSGTTSATTALLVQNSTPTELFKVTDDGVVSMPRTTIQRIEEGNSRLLRLTNIGDTGAYNGGFSFSVGFNGASNNATTLRLWNNNSTGSGVVGVGDLTEGNLQSIASSNTFVIRSRQTTSTGYDAAFNVSTSILTDYTVASGKVFGFHIGGVSSAPFIGNFNSANQLGSFIGYQYQPLTSGWAGSLVFYNRNDSSTAVECLRLQGKDGNVGINTTDASARLHVRGSGTTSSTTALLVQNSTPTANFTIRDDGGYAFRNGTVGLAQTGYTTFTNLTTDRTCDANATTVEELADILGTLIEDLKTKGIIAA